MIMPAIWRWRGIMTGDGKLEDSHRNGPRFKAMAAGDSDLEGLRNRPDFGELINDN